ncbi:ferredoxin [Streptomyces sp. ITFR-16]|uniref:ferredoxin n=1 Tax=Streptomyces sp. ITFR-16 TaxID=3075198 RepID=UPI00288AED32|nr:ferredoxin [Streptomyces sp. ITFR-16]WNI23156.1 ferredoxin [Streptomyces sp. ITFR-16]
MRIDIDRDVCIGAGQCALAAPKVFTQDDDGLSELLPEAEAEGGAGPAAGPMVGEAARACPVQAITVT